MRLLALVGVVVLTLCTPGCQQKAETPKAPVAKTFKFIAVLSEGQVKAGVESAKNAASNCEVLFTKTAEEQVSLLEKFASGGVDGIAIECIPSPEVSAAVKKCFEKGVPVVAFGGDCVVPDAGPLMPEGLAVRPATGRQSIIGASPAHLGTVMAAELAKTIPSSDAKVQYNVTVISFDHPSIRPIEDAAVAYLKTAYVGDNVSIVVRDPVRVAGSETAIADAVKAAIASGTDGWLILNPVAAANKGAALADIVKGSVVTLAVQADDIDSYLLGDRIQKAVSVKVVLVPYVAYGQVAVQMLDGITREHLNYADVYPVPLTIVDSGNCTAVKTRFAAMVEPKALPDGTTLPPSVYPAIPGGRLKDVKPPSKEETPAAPTPAEQPAAAPAPGDGDKPAEPASN